MKNLYLKIGILLTALLFSNFASAEDIADMFKNSANTWEAGITLTKGIAMLGGVLISCGALFKLKEMTQVGHNGYSVWIPISWFLIGAALITIPMQIDVAAETLSLSDSSGSDVFGSANSDSSAWSYISDTIKYVFVFIVFIGHLAFVRGFFILKDVSMKKGDKTLAGALTHILGGSLCININSTIAILGATFAPGLMS